MTEVKSGAEGPTQATKRDHENVRMPWRVLLAEDDIDMRLLIKAALTKDGYDVTDARDGAEVLERLQEALASPLNMPDVIVMDIVMPRYSGLGVLAALRSANWQVPVIVMSAIGETSIREKARQLGAAAFIKKPFDINDLRAAVISATTPGEEDKAGGKAH